MRPDPIVNRSMFVVVAPRVSAKMPSAESRSVSADTPANDVSCATLAAEVTSSSKLPGVGVPVTKTVAANVLDEEAVTAPCAPKMPSVEKTL